MVSRCLDIGCRKLIVIYIENLIFQIIEKINEILNNKREIDILK